MSRQALTPFHIFVFLLCLSVLAPSASARTLIFRVDKSVEWKTVSSDLILLGQITRVDVESPLTETSHQTVHLDVEEILKGGFAEDLDGSKFSFRIETRLRLAKELRWAGERAEKYGPRNKDLRLLFFAAGETPDMPWRLSFLGYPMASTLGVPGKGKELVPVERKALDWVRSTVAQKDEALEKLTRNPAVFVRTPLNSRPGSNSIAPRGAVVWEIESRRALIVPAVPRLKQHAFDLCASRDERERARGAFMLRSYTDAASTLLLMHLLHDPYYSGRYDSDCKTYHVRAAAYDTLRDRGVEVDMPVLDTCPESANWEDWARKREASTEKRAVVWGDVLPEESSVTESSESVPPDGEEGFE